MQIFVGLGNPGAKYARNRHNIGFMALDAIADAHGFGPWRAKFQAEIAEGRLGTERVMLLKPQTFMNLSGQAVGEAMRYVKCAPEEITVFHDELDLVPGKCRVKKGGGHAGHNGLRSLHQHIGDSYARVRLGIGHPGHKDRVSGYVLHDFAAAERDWLEALLAGIAKGAVKLAAGDASGFMNAVALEMGPLAPAEPKPKPKKPKPAAKDAPAAAETSGDSAGAPAEESASPFAALTGLFRRK
ncbi:aminoacyl-tRNA hydrolase [Paralimibaculum aggregatum]|uniref:Peptidyl-tRNA hydrolase n=1 Tax=Paralimibaculum aggregatum TaxID=3036245 RepID=A0ABQ6LJJ0_9RHOB|nr:aminoacyl-tRNA hydrolase [Limibaculum sp. NKW23]GMG83432.1 aminoacyl-tRNA hydrolase [Limibaculum sp. NKW23]